MSGSKTTSTHKPNSVDGGVHSTETEEKRSLLSETNDDSDIRKRLEEYDNVLKATKQAMLKPFALAIALDFAYNLRCNLIVLYARTFSSHTTILISLMVYLSYLYNAVFGLIFGMIGDHWRFDNLMVILTFVDVLCFGLEATTYNFWVLFVVYPIGAQPMSSLYLGYMTKLLPLNTSRKYITQVWSLIMLAFMLGPVIGGLTASYYGYRAVFYLSFGIGIFYCGYTAIFITNGQKTLENRQLSLDITGFDADSDHFKDEDNIFPVIRYKDEPDGHHHGHGHGHGHQHGHGHEHNHHDHHGHAHGHHHGHHHGHGNTHGDEHGHDHGEIAYPNLLVYLSFIQQSMIASYDGVFFTYYTVYFLDEFDQTVLVSTGQLSVMTVLAIFGFMMVGKISEYFNNSYLALMVFILIADTILLILFFLVFPNITRDYLWLLWIIISIFGFLGTSAMMASDFLILQYQTKSEQFQKSTGLLQGAKESFHIGSQAFAILFVGLLYDSNHDWLWYILGIATSISFVLVIVVFLVHFSCKKK